MQMLLALFIALAQIAGSASLENAIDCAMAQHYREKIERHHKDLRDGNGDSEYDCKLEVEARRKQDNPGYKLPKGLGMVKIKLPKSNGKTTVQNLQVAFKSMAQPGNERKLLQMTSPLVTRYGCWGKFYPQIYDELSVLCVYDPKVRRSKKMDHN